MGMPRPEKWEDSSKDNTITNEIRGVTGSVAMVATNVFRKKKKLDYECQGN
jgi:hypothetical protein